MASCAISIILCFFCEFQVDHSKVRESTSKFKGKQPVSPHAIDFEEDLVRNELRFGSELTTAINDIYWNWYNDNEIKKYADSFFEAIIYSDAKNKEYVIVVLN